MDLSSNLTGIEALRKALVTRDFSALVAVGRTLTKGFWSSELDAGLFYCLALLATDEILEGLDLLRSLRQHDPVRVAGVLYDELRTLAFDGHEDLVEKLLSLPEFEASVILVPVLRQKIDRVRAAQHRKS